MGRVALEVAFDLELAHGRCLGVRIPKGGDVTVLADLCLLQAERAYASRLGPIRRRSWVGGRAALRELLSRQGWSPPPILPNARGAPDLPSHLVGSISHKEDLAVALVCPGGGAFIGVDIENDSPRNLDIAPRILTGGEQREIEALDATARSHEVLLRFSAKEALYKALDPFVKRYVGFREVSVTPRSDGSAEVRSHLPASDGGPYFMEARWKRFDGIILTTARVALHPRP